MRHDGDGPALGRRGWTDELRWLWRHIYITHVLILGGAPILYLYLLPSTSFQWRTILLTGASYLCGGIGITAGYHRLWSHRSYKASLPLRYFLAIMGAGQFQWSIIWWVQHHRAHHRYTDTEKDPYNASRGFYYSHWGWLFGYNPKSWGEVDMSDVLSDPVAVWQQRYLVYIGIPPSVIIPPLIAHYGWNDGLGGFVHGVLGRLLWIWHLGFMVNSLAHTPWFGSQPYSTKHSARNVLLFAWVLAGEASHNFHHTFPADYRNGIYWYEGDLSRWFIQFCARVGLAWDLVATSEAEIQRARDRKLQLAEGIARSSEVSNLPEMQWNEFREQAAGGRSLLVIHGVVYDVSDFMADHPGGPALVQQFIGEDATKAFYDNGHHVHSPYAESLLSHQRVAITRLPVVFDRKKE